MTRTKLRKRWIEALRSDRYQQVQGRLKAKNGYCCLGVAADVIGETFYPSTTCEGIYYLIDRSSHEIRTSMLPDRVVGAYGLRDAMGAFSTPWEGKPEAPKLVSLTCMNDKGYTFAQIADFIEQHPDEVFIDEE